MGDTIKVLDHGELKLVDHMGSDESIVRSARISYDGEAGLDLKKDTKLIRYLMKHHHNTPFESVQFTFYVKAPIFVFRQWHRHRTQSYNEVSARYTQLPEQFYLPEVKYIGKQSEINNQARVIPSGKQKKKDRESQVERYRVSCKEAFITYRELLNQGWPREVARGVLPVSTYSQMFASMNLHNLFNFLGERTHEDAQYEIRVYADAMFDLIRPIVPIACQAWLDRLEGEL